MILKEIELKPLAGIPDHLFRFEKKLSVILGPNEAGKSTLYNALKLAMFVPSEPNKRVFEKEVRPFLPINGGNSIRVTLQFSIGGSCYRLLKSWGGKPISELHEPGGILIVGSEPVQERLNELLGFKRGTYESVLFGTQGQLHSTLENIDVHSVAFEDFAAELRKAFLETDGISIDALQRAIEQKRDEYYKRWDQSLDQPEGGRDIDNPWVQSRGIILQAYYEQEETRRDLEDVIEFETELANLYRKLETNRGNEAKLKKREERMGKLAEMLTERSSLERTRNSIVSELKRLRKIEEEWPKRAKAIAAAQKKVASTEKKVTEMGRTVERAEEARQLVLRRQKFEQAQKLKKRLGQVERKLEGVNRVTESNIAELRKLTDKLTRLRASIEAGKISLVLKVKRDTAIRYKKDFETEKTRRLKVGEGFGISAGGQIELSHPSLDIEVRSGDSDFQEIRAELDEASTEYTRLLKEHGAKDVPSVEKMFQTYTTLRERREELAEQLSEALEGEQFEELKKEVSRFSAAKGEKTDIELGVQYGKLKAEIKSLKDKIRDYSKEILEWQMDFDSVEGLEDKIRENEEELKQTRKQLSSFGPAPSGVKDIEEYLGKYEATRAELESVQDEIRASEIEKARLEAQTPNESSEQLEEYLVDLEERLRRVKEEGKALDVLMSRFLELRDELDSEFPDMWLQEFENVAGPLTQVRYKAVTLGRGGTGASTQNSEGIDYPFELLSMGTKAVLGLALRLTMAKRFLADTGGFLVLDDPLVDMDPERQEVAAKVLQRFAEDAQTIVLTCHPECAKLFGGATTTLKTA